MAEYLKPLPTLTDENRPFWQGCKEGKLRLQQCNDCGHIRYPISHCCPKCLSYQFEWKDLSGRGEVFSYVVFHQLYNKAFEKDIPYNVALVQLEEGPRMYTNIVGEAALDVAIGDPVQVTFDDRGEGCIVPQFTLARK